MTANCPRCGGKWDCEGLREDYSGCSHRFDIPEGGRVEIYCYYCGTTIEYHLSRDQELKFAVEREANLFRIIDELEKKILEVGNSLEKTKK